MNRSSSQGSRSLTGSRHGHREASFPGSFGGGSSFGGEFKTEETIAEVRRRPKYVAGRWI